MFIGEYNHSLDSKGRIIIPSKYREELGQEFIVTRGLEKSLWIFSMKGWTEFLGKLSDLPKINTNASRITRHFSAGATSCELDKQGRILLPANLREFAELDKEVVLAGVIERIEIWNKSLWSNVSTIDSIDSIAEDIAKLGIII